MKNKIYFGGLLLLIVIFFGCLTVNFAPANMSKRYEKKVPASSVQIFRTKLPEKEYIEIGSVNINGGSPSQIADAIRKKAAEVGGDAVINFEPYSGGTSATVIRYVHESKNAI